MIQKNPLDRLLEEYNLTRYQFCKDTGLTDQKLAMIVKRETPMIKMKLETLIPMKKRLGISLDLLVDKLLRYEKESINEKPGQKELWNMNDLEFESNGEYTVASFFGGVGGIDIGFENTERFTTRFINEFDKNAQETISLNFPETPLDRRDIREVEAKDVPKTDVIVGGFPCQAFSVAGYRKGFEDERGDLFFELLRIIKHHRPRVVFVENVKNMVTHDNGNTFKVIREALALNGYFIKWKVLNSKDYGNIPQNRERIYVVGFNNKEAYDKFVFPDKVKLTNGLETVIDFNSKVDDKYYYSRGVQNFYDELEKEITTQDTVYQWRRQYVRANKNGVVPTLTANMGTGGHNVPLILSDHGIRKLTPKEAFNVQGFPEDFKMPEISNGQLYKQAGNSVVVPVIERIADNIAFALENSSERADFSDEALGLEGSAPLYVKMNGAFDGQCYMVQGFNEWEQTMERAREFSLPILDDEAYMKIVKKKGLSQFMTVQSM